MAALGFDGDAWAPVFDRIRPAIRDDDSTTSMKYTGEAMLGTATMHKSNGVPVFSKESIVEINTMRRG